MVTFKQLRDMMKVKGSGTLATREHLVSSFMRLHLSVQGTVRFVLGDEEKVVVETDDNLLDYVQTVNSGRTLYVTSENKLRAPDFSHLLVTIYLRQLDTLNLASNGEVTCPDPLRVDNPLDVKIAANGHTTLHLEAPSITLQVASNGNLTLAGAAGELAVRVASNGHLDAHRFRAQHLKIRNGSNGNVDVYAEQTIAIIHRGSGYIHYAGPARLTDIRQHGAGEVRHVVRNEE